DSGTFLVSLSVAKEIHYVVIRNRALSACSYLALLYAWTNAVISTVIYKKEYAQGKVQLTMRNAITLQ
ncbi:MAG: hypothetical protein RR271_04810, partial [Oscillospiraceae bacterium]